MPYRIMFSRQADEHLASLSAHRRSRLLDAIEIQLLHQPTTATRNRKPMLPGRHPFVAPWELRVGDMRVYYDVEDEPAPLVLVAAIAVKVHQVLYFGGRPIEQ